MFLLIGSRPPRAKLLILVFFFSDFLVLVLGLVDHSMHSIDGFLAKYGSFHFRNDWSSRNNFRKRPNTTAAKGLHLWHDLVGTRLIERRMTSLSVFPPCWLISEFLYLVQKRVF